MAKEKYYFDEKEAAKFKTFIEKLNLPKGKKGQKIKLLDYQLKIATDIIATKRKSDGLRRYREIFITMARKNSKSFIAAIIILYLFFTDDEMGQENIVAANSREQADNIYNMIEYMIRTNKTLMKHCVIVNSRRRILRKVTDSFIQIVSSDTSKLDGFNPYIAAVDETHEDKTGGENYTKLQTGQGARDEPIIMSITTASNGMDEHNLEYQKYQYALKVQSGEVEDDSFYAAIYRADDDCDIEDEEQWTKANPGIDLLPGGFRKSDELRRLSKQAKVMPALIPGFRRYYLNQHVVLEAERAINMKYWNNKDNTISDLSFLKGKACYAGLDLSVDKDFTALVLVFPIDDEYHVLPYLFKPAETLISDGKVDKFPYEAYAKQGYMIATKGDFVNFRYVRQIIEELSREYDIKEIVFDKFASSGIASDLQNDGFIMVDHVQGFGFSPTIADFYDLLYENKLKHPNNPVFNWMAESTVAIENSQGRIKFDKTQGKIDGIIAMLMGLTRAIANNKKQEYDPNKAIEDWANNMG
ncbi:terminase large subunit [Oceanobacillus indicireducens]|uniref:Phage terminase n=1 Tax=Oceanobacillus indicireducens TaxID=1004261 RepID=A0A917Y0D9_9BACI|nr:terminase TerL endonuclease subunit [Oceanobacillus indicireducens]GGN59380.1 phage terminase [Oceanobacillus indicireducens]